MFGFQISLELIDEFKKYIGASMAFVNYQVVKNIEPFDDKIRGLSEAHELSVAIEAEDIQLIAESVLEMLKPKRDLSCVGPRASRNVSHVQHQGCRKVRI